MSHNIVKTVAFGVFVCLPFNVLHRIFGLKPACQTVSKIFFYVDIMGSVRRDVTLDLLCALSDELPGFKFLGNFREQED